MTDFSELTSIADKYKKKALELDLKAQQDIKQAYRKSAVTFIKVLSRVVKRNNSSTVEEILIRKDVEEAFSASLVSARTSATKIVEEAFQKGVALGIAQAKEEASLFGLEADINSGDTLTPEPEVAKRSNRSEIARRCSSVKVPQLNVGYLPVPKFQSMNFGIILLLITSAISLITV